MCIRDRKILSAIKAIKPFFWEIPPIPEFKMTVPAQVFATEPMLKDMSNDLCLKQLINVAAMPGIVGQAIAMPDAHQGYGFPIGGVAATEFPHGNITPGGIGYDINCGVRLLVSGLFKAEVTKHIGKLTAGMIKAVPTGLGGRGLIKLSMQEMDAVLRDGALWTVRHGFGNASDLECIESGGTIVSADARCVPKNAKERGLGQLGTLGSGNHFVEIGYVDKVFDSQLAQSFGLKKDLVTLMIHTGSRGIGHQTATEYIKTMHKYTSSNHITLPDSQLACAPLSSEQGKTYFAAMCAAANYAFANRQLISHEARKVWSDFFGNNHELRLLYDVAHNIAKIEKHKVPSRGETKLIVHRKGATRAFGPGNRELAARFAETGQPVLIPGSMGSASYVLAGREKDETWHSCCHGAGRLLSRGRAKREFRGQSLKEELMKAGIAVETKDLSSLGEEAPRAYKDVEGVVNVVTLAGIAKKVARIRPFGVVK
eukprot:TRINITY_DN4366_c0_g1_i2.p1 TRINITY_DN4366_c0_g1~~TRINITY_DN4366_c0_g1_i2.p1  ORF type:complete len:484 (+),score=118.66 TRINITY_DN4366_c0_g1_i2:67-1518(+)